MCSLVLRWHWNQHKHEKLCFYDQHKRMFVSIAVSNIQTFYHYQAQALRTLLNRQKRLHTHSLLAQARSADSTDSCPGHLWFYSDLLFLFSNNDNSLCFHNLLQPGKAFFTTRTPRGICKEGFIFHQRLNCF